MKSKLPLLLILLPYFLFGQEIVNPLDDLTQQSPEVAAMMSFNNHVLNGNTGASSYSIPLAQITNGSISVSVGLNYIGNQNQVNNIPSWVGLGWSLSGIGVITKSVNTSEDLGRYGYRNSNIDSIYNDLYNFKLLGETIPYDNSTPITRQKEFNRKLGYLKYDLAPDLYTLNVNGINAKFFINHKGEVLVESDQNINISYDRNIFKVIDNNGNQYFFGSNDEGRNGIADYIGDQIYMSTWMLTKMISSDGINEINFIYGDKEVKRTNYSESYIYSYNSLGNFSQNVLAQDNLNVLLNGGFKNNTSYSSTFGKTRLTKIISDDDTLEFNAIQDRRDIVFYNDVLLHGEEYYLDQVVFKNGSTIKKNIQLKYNYDAKDDILSDTHNDIELSDENRLILKKVIINHGSDSTLANSYHLDYFIGMDKFPPYSSKSIDYWGYYNKSENQFLLPGPLPANIETNKLSNKDGNQLGILKQVILPTGGKVRFNYESNIVSNKEFSNFLSLIRNKEDVIKSTDLIINSDFIEVGGSRVKNIAFYDSEENLLKTISYKYEDGIFNKPFIPIIKKKLHYEEYTLTESGEPGFLFRNHEIPYYEMISNNLINSNSGEVVNYKRVIESVSGQESNNGFKISDFLVRTYLESSKAEGDSISGTIPLTFPFAFIKGDTFYNNRLIKESVYNNNSIKVSEFSYTYESKLGDQIKSIYFNMDGRHASNDGSIDSHHYNSAWFSDRSPHELYSINLYKQTLYKNILKQTKSKKYGIHNNGSNEIIVNYIYDEYYNVVSKTTTRGSIEILKEDISYAINTGDNSLKMNLLKRNLTSLPSETKQIKSGKVISNQKFSYKLNTLENSELKYPYLEKVESRSSLNSEFKKVYQTVYDNNNKLVQITNKEGISKTILWDKTSKYVVFIIDNCNYEHIINSVDIENIDKSPSEEIINSIMDNSGLGLVSTYKYNNRGLIETIIDPNGMEQLFEYDDMDRLTSKSSKSLKEDANFELLQLSIYHYVN